MSDKLAYLEKINLKDYEGKASDKFEKPTGHATIQDRCLMFDNIFQVFFPNYYSGNLF